MMRALVLTLMLSPLSALAQSASVQPQPTQPTLPAQPAPRLIIMDSESIEARAPGPDGAVVAAEPLHHPRIASLIRVRTNFSRELLASVGQLN